MSRRYQPHDAWYRKARASGLRSRAAFKLTDLLRRLPQVRPGSTVVELGCWPGGWLQVLADVVGPDGRVVGVDVEEVSSLGPNVATLRLDMTADDAADRIAEALGRPADAVLSDAAPKLCGIRDVDRAAGEELCCAALAIAARVLRPGGAIVVKAFPGPETERFRADLRRRFGKVDIVRPDATRKTSKEFYLVAGAPPGR